MSFSSRRRNYLLTPHRRDELIEWMKEMLKHSFVLDALDETGADTFSHFEVLIDEHRRMSLSSSTSSSSSPSRLRQLVPTVGHFHTRLPLRRAFLFYNAKYRITARKHVCISFNEIRHILNLAQIMAFVSAGDNASHVALTEPSPNPTSNPTDTSTVTRHGPTDTNDNDESDDDDDDEGSAKRWSSVTDSPSIFMSNQTKSLLPPATLMMLPELELPQSQETTTNETSMTMTTSTTTATTMTTTTTNTARSFAGPRLISFDGDQTLYSDGGNFDSNPKLATYLYLLLRHGVTVAVVTAAGYEYQTAKYEMRLSGLLDFFRAQGLTPDDCSRFFLFGGECNYLLTLGADYHLCPVREHGPGGWMTSTRFHAEAPGNWNEDDIGQLLDVAETTFRESVEQQNLRARVIRKRRAVGMIPLLDPLPREALDETVLIVQERLASRQSSTQTSTTTKHKLPYCAFNGGRDVWVDVGNKRVGVQLLQSYLGVSREETLHIGDQFLNTGNDYAARDVCPCVWITSPEETTYILKSILRLAGVSHHHTTNTTDDTLPSTTTTTPHTTTTHMVNFQELQRRTQAVQLMDVFTGEMLNHKT